MPTFFDVFGLATVLLRGLDLVARTVLVGSVLFELLGLPRTRDPDVDTEELRRPVRSIVGLAAAATIVTSIAAMGVNAAMLEASLDVSLREVIGARFVAYDVARALAAAAILILVRVHLRDDLAMRSALVVLGGVTLYTALGESHAAARLSDSNPLYAATLAHQLGAALWLGGLPCFRRALLAARTRTEAAAIGVRYSRLSIAGVALIVAGAATFAVVYIGSPPAAYGTAYGAMALVKTTFLALLLLLGLHNFTAVRAIASDPRALPRVSRFATVEMGIAVAALMAAASITSAPPAVDLVDDRVTLSELAARWSPEPPRLTSPDRDSLAIPALQAQLDAQWRVDQLTTRGAAYVPGTGALPPRNAFDVAWSEYNHHWAGLLVVAIGIAALLARSGRAPWARHWPLLFIGVAVLILLRGDPEVWPTGPVGLIESLKDSEVLQHRVFALLLIAFALFEWRVQTGRTSLARSRRMFPMLVVLAATLLLTHSHSLGNIKQELLVETTHLPIAVLGVIAGWARWLDVEAPSEPDGRVAAWIWPACFVAIGLLLLDYREA